MSVNARLLPSAETSRSASRIAVDFSSSASFSDSLRVATGIDIRIAAEPVCSCHRSPWEFFRDVHVGRPSLALILGARGTGKSYLSALDTHLTSLEDPGHGTRVLGGSLAQSEQIYRCLGLASCWIGEDDPVRALLKTGAEYRNGSEVAILPASSTSVRGPHVPTLKLDEVDEIDPEHFEAAMGMCMKRRGSEASVVMTSTWHRLGGPMSGLIERAKAGEFGLYTMCIFEVLETCTEERSGPKVGGRYAKCPACPLEKYCYEEGGAEPKAKRSKGHYSIEALIQKLRTTGRRTFEADYLCKGPKADGLWFPTFDPATHVGTAAEYDPALPVHLAIDSGVFTGAVFFQLTRDPTGISGNERIHVFADYLREGASAEVNARDILAMAQQRCNGRFDRLSTDPAGGSRNPMGTTVIAEYERVGLRPLLHWPTGSVADGLSLLESFAHPADGGPRLLIHPRCRSTIAAMQSYRRAKRGGQWQDYPEDPQHPHEELVDSLRGGLRLCYPEGRGRQVGFPRVSARQVF